MRSSRAWKSVNILVALFAFVGTNIALAADGVLLAKSMKLGVRFYVHTGNSQLGPQSWCDSIVIIRAEATYPDIFGTRPFANLVPKIARLIEQECDAVFEIELHGYGPSDPLRKLLAVALKKEDWKMHRLEE